jgi:FkbH-like protein
LFIDDQQFERSEVAFAHPDVRVVDVARVGELLTLPELDAAITEEARHRRRMYKVQEMRESAFREADSSFVDFLKSCQLVLTITDVTSSNVDRVFELSQRTNQLNYAGRASTRKDIEDLISPTNLGMKGFVLSCLDKFGDYGIIGFAITDINRFHVSNFFMSCRVQHKKVDHAFFAWLLRHANAIGRDHVSTTFHFSGRNQSARQVLEEMNFSPSPEEEDVFVSPRLEALPEGDLVKVIDRTQSTNDMRLERTMAS